MRKNKSLLYQNELAYCVFGVRVNASLGHWICDLRAIKGGQHSKA